MKDTVDLTTLAVMTAFVTRIIRIASRLTMHELSGPVAGVCARMDGARDVRKAPTGIEKGIIDAKRRSRWLITSGHGFPVGGMLRCNGAAA